MLSYNVFRTRESDVYFPEDRPVPSFLLSRAWEFKGKVAENAGVALPRAAKIAVRFNGFYIFHPFETPEIAA
jgi:hypothetical protein